MKPRRRTKIVATIGPASWDESTLRGLIAAGMDVARLNFSHGDHAGHSRSAERLRALAEEAGRPVAILQDLQGPKIRIGRLRGGGPVRLLAGAELTITTDDTVGDEGRVSTTYRAFPRDVRPGDPVLLDDGLLQLRVLSVSGADVRCEVVGGGLLAERKGINLPGTRISAPALTEKDREDLAFGVGLGVDYVALSFVRRAEDVKQARELLRSLGADTPVVAKIERIEAVENLDAILDAADGVMVARGDLGVETSSADVPIMQKDIIRASNRRRRLDITATQMLQSMVENPRPTRAEACDVANAVFDGTDAIMLSGETAAGKYPVESVAAMGEIALRAEGRLADLGRLPAFSASGREDASEATVCAAALAARASGARLIACMTRSGRTAVLLSQLRPETPVVGLTPEPAAYRRLALAWGVVPVLTEEAKDPADLARVAQAALKREDLAGPGDAVVLVAGRATASGATNTMRIIEVECLRAPSGDALRFSWGGGDGRISVSA